MGTLQICFIAGLLSLWSGIVHAKCSFAIRDIQLDFPVPVQTNLFISTNDVGVFEINQGTTFDLFCSTKFVIGGLSLRTVTCDAGQNVIYNAMLPSVPLSDAQFKCKSNNYDYDLRTLNVPGQYQLGYNIANGFQPVVELLFDSANKRTVYASHQILPVKPTQHQVITAKFSSTFRGDTKFSTTENNLYKKNNHRNTICNSILKVTAAKCDQYFDASSKYLARGHLAPSADQVYTATKRATYSMLNIAPQWQQLNNGQWKKLEGSLRAYSIVNGVQLDLITGTLGTMQLPDAQGQPKELYLDGVSKIPVPLVFYKIVLDHTKRKGIVFLAINNPYASASDVDNAINMVGCQDIYDSERLFWPSIWYEDYERPGEDKEVRWMYNRNTEAFRMKGYMYACTVQNFDNVRNILSPNLKQSVQNYALLTL